MSREAAETRNREIAETLVRTNGGTPMGNLMRRYWVPVLLSSEIAEKDGPQVRVKILGERLLAFRDSEGQAGLIDEFCSHRGASLFLGRTRRAAFVAPTTGSSSTGWATAWTVAKRCRIGQAARACGVTPATVRKWLGRFLAQGAAGLADVSSRPSVSPRMMAPAKALAIVELRRKRLTQARIAQALGVAARTFSRVLARAGLSRLADLERAEPAVRYEHTAPGELLHIDIKKLGRVVRPGHRVTGNRRGQVEGAGWDFVFVAIDDHARVAFTDIHPDERIPSAMQFLQDAMACYARLGVTIKRLLTDNGSTFRSRAFEALCRQLGIQHRFTRPYLPQTKGKAERFIQSALHEWAYAYTYQNSQHRADAMKSWLHHYIWHRPHQGIGRAVPISRHNLDGYDVLTLHS